MATDSSSFTAAIHILLAVIVFGTVSGAGFVAHSIGMNIADEYSRNTEPEKIRLCQQGTAS